MPEERPITDDRHWLRQRLRHLPQPHSLATTKKNDFHELRTNAYRRAVNQTSEFSWIHAAAEWLHSTDANLRNRNHKSAAPLPNIAILGDDFVFQVPGQNEKKIRLRFSNVFRR